MVEYNYIERLCPICNSAKRELLDEYDRSFRLVQGVGTWHVKNFVCSECGFVYATPVPSENSLRIHYSNSYPVKFEDYSADNRIKFIDLCCSTTINESKKLRYAELGANNQMPFHVKLKTRFQTVDRFDINARSNSQDVNYCCDVKNETPYDLVAAYYVLEHVIDPLKFLQACKSLSQRILIEIPDLYEYRYDQSGYFLHEHLNHFSVHTFCELSKKVNLRIEKISKLLCSRNFGTAYYLVADENRQTSTGEIEAMYAMECVTIAKMKIQGREYQLTKTANKILKDTKDGFNIVLWCANEDLRDVLNHISDDASFFVIDSNHDKKHFLADLGVKTVFHPDEEKGRNAIHNANKFYIFSQLHYQNILDAIASMKGVNVNALNVEII